MSEILTRQGHGGKRTPQTPALNQSEQRVREEIMDVFAAAGAELILSAKPAQEVRREYEERVKEIFTLCRADFGLEATVATFEHQGLTKFIP
jgi:hypothetical protein